MKVWLILKSSTDYQLFPIDISRPVSVKVPSWAVINDLIPNPVPGPGGDAAPDSRLPGCQDASVSFPVPFPDQHCPGSARHWPARTLHITQTSLAGWVELGWVDLSLDMLSWVGFGKLSWVGLSWVMLGWFDFDWVDLSWVEIGSGWVQLCWYWLNMVGLVKVVKCLDELRWVVWVELGWAGLRYENKTRGLRSWPSEKQK